MELRGKIAKGKENSEFRLRKIERLREWARRRPNIKRRKERCNTHQKRGRFEFRKR